MKKTFRSSMFGFNKDDVATFISKQSKQYEKKITDLEKEKLALTEEYETVISGLNTEKEELNQYREKMESHFASFGVARILCKKIHEQCAAILDTFDTAVNKVSSLEKTNAKMRIMLSAAEEFREKAKRFDQLSTVLSGIVSGKDATRISDDAQNTNEVSFEVPELEKVDLVSLGTAMKSLVSDCSQLAQMVSEAVDE